MLWIRKVSFPFALLYALVVRLRNWLYDIRFFKSYSFEQPIICIGNLSVGGTGKTPMTDFLISGFKKNYRVAVLSRGYKRKSKGFQLAHQGSTVEDLGDEPLQLYRKHRDIAVAVNADRVAGIQKLRQMVQPDLILLDDALQHRRVKAGFSILLTTFQNPFYEDFYLPFGDLRDSKKEYKRADVIVITKCPDTLSDRNMAEMIRQINPLSHQQVLFAYLGYAKILKGSYDELGFEGLLRQDVALVTGIANAAPLVAHLKAKGLQFEHYEFADHHFFSEEEIAKFKRHKFVITTEKDFTRLQRHLENCYYLGVSHQFLKQGAYDLARLLNQRFKLDFEL